MILNQYLNEIYVFLKTYETVISTKLFKKIKYPIQLYLKDSQHKTNVHRNTSNFRCSISY